MEIKKTPVQIPLTWLHVWLLFAGIYGFAAGFLELTGREALYFCAISLLLLIPAAASWILIRKTKALWQFLLGGIAVCAVTYLAAKFFCSLFSVQAAAVIEASVAANDGKNKFENGISPAFLESLSGVMTGLMAAVIFLIRGYVRIRKGQLKKAAQELPAGSMPLADMEAWEIPTLLDEPKAPSFSLVYDTVCDRCADENAVLLASDLLVFLCRCIPVLLLPVPRRHARVHP